MTDSTVELFTKYLAGDADATEIRRLHQVLADDPQAVDALMSEAYMDVEIREALGGSAMEAMLAKVTQEDRLAPVSIAGPWLPSRVMAAALLLVAVSGWGAVAYVVGRLGDARANIDSLKNRVAELENASTPEADDLGQQVASGGTHSVPDIHKDAPEIHSVRGWLMALSPDAQTENELLLVGTSAPLDRRLWTCPWGAAEFRLGPNVSISVERNTTMTFNETDERRRLTLESGIVHVTNMSESDERPTEIESAQAMVRLVRGQVAIQVDKQKTSVEVAVDQVEVVVTEDGVGRTITVRQGQYLLIKSGEKAKVINGMLKLGLQPPNV